MKEAIYLNHAATSQQKPQEMIEALTAYLQENCVTNTQRGAQLYGDERIHLEARLSLANFFHVSQPEGIIFTPNITTALNMIIHGRLKKGDHVITTSIEHNAVMRPLQLLKKKLGIKLSILPCSKDGQLDSEILKQTIREETKMLIMSHASNVLGTILPVQECFQLARKYGVLTVLDTAQTAGFLPIDMQELSVDVLAFTGHKGLLGPAGIGGFILTQETAERIEPWLSGGTGSISESLEQPAFLPDKFEAGTLNTMGILGLGKSIEFLQKNSLKKIAEREQKLTRQLLKGLDRLPVKILGTKVASARVPLVSVVSEKMAPNELTDRLYSDYQIITRSGLHCAPLAHQTAGTSATGAVRFSLGYETTPAEIDYTLYALEKILEKE